MDRRGTSLAFQYDVLDRRTNIAYGTESTVKLQRDSVGRVTNVVDSVAGSNVFTYDSLDRLTKEVAQNGTINYTYNDVGLRTNAQVTGQAAVKYRYDNGNRLTNVVQASDSVSLFYDDDGRRTKLVLPNGINVLYSYDSSSRLTNITYQAAATNAIDYAYFADGNRFSQNSGLAVYGLPSAVSSATYNAANQQLTFGSYTMQYDANGNVTNLSDGATTKTLNWTVRNQLTNMTGAVAANFLYDGLGRRITRAVSDVTEKYMYDGLDILLQKDSGGSVRARYLRGLAIDEPWQRSEVAETATTSGIIGFWKCNEGSGTSLADSSGNGITGTLNNGTGWTSDGVFSNALALAGDNDWVSMGDANQLEGLNAFTMSAWVRLDNFATSRDQLIMYKNNVLNFAFRSNFPQQVSLRIGGGSSWQSWTTSDASIETGVWTHVAVTYTNSTVKFYVDGRLTDTKTQTYTMGSNANNFQLSHATQTLDGDLDDLRYYNRALTDSEVGAIFGESAAARIYLADALGSIVALTDSGKKIITELNYDPFGVTTPAGNRNAFRFTAREDDGTGLYYYRARYYQPTLGRFVSEDPIEFVGGEFNLYAYARNNSSNMTDPLGLQARQLPGWLIKFACLGATTRTLHLSLDAAQKELDNCLETCDAIACAADAQKCISDCKRTFALNAAIASTEFTAYSLGCAITLPPPGYKPPPVAPPQLPPVPPNIN